MKKKKSSMIPRGVGFKKIIKQEEQKSWNRTVIIKEVGSQQGRSKKAEYFSGSCNFIKIAKKTKILA